MIEFNWNNVCFCVTDIGGDYLGENIPRHAHSKHSYELHFILEGHGRLVTDTKTYYLKKGDFFITGPNIYHAQSPDENAPLKDVFIMLEVRHAKHPTAVASFFLENRFCFFENFDSSFAAVILKEYRAKLPDYESAVAGLCCKILTDITRCLLPKEFENLPQTENLNDRRFVLIEQAFLYVPDLTLTQLSRSIGLCERQTQRLLKKYYGKSFRQKKNEIKDTKKQPKT